VPPGATIAFRDFQARGGFHVSAEMVNGQVSGVAITARRSIPCRLKNPWPGRRVRVRRGDGEVPIHNDPQFADGLVFHAEAKVTYALSMGDEA
jgi:hypothetical protein